MRAKRFMKNAINVLCTSCMAISGFFYFDKISLLLFGEPEYPEE